MQICFRKYLFLWFCLYFDYTAEAAVWGGCPPGRVGLIWEMPLTLVPPFAQITSGPFLSRFNLLFCSGGLFFLTFAQITCGLGSGTLFFLSHFNLLFCFWPEYFYNTEEWLLSPYLFSDHSCAMWQNEWANEWPAHVTLFSQEIIPKRTVINWIGNLTLTFLFPFTSFESSLAGRSLTITLHIFTHSPLALARLRQQFGISAGLFLACLLFLIIFKLNKNEFNLIELNLI